MVSFLQTFQDVQGDAGRTLAHVQRLLQELEEAEVAAQIAQTEATESIRCIT